ELIAYSAMLTGLPNGAPPATDCRVTAALALQANQSQAAASNLRVLKDSQASLAEIRASFQWLDAQEDANTTVVILYSGHRAQQPDDNGDEADGLDEIITAYDTNENGGTFSKFIRDDELGRWLSELESQRIVVILDSCFSGGMSSG